MKVQITYIVDISDEDISDFIAYDEEGYEWEPGTLPEFSLEEYSDDYIETILMEQQEEGNYLSEIVYDDDIVSIKVLRDE